MIKWVFCIMSYLWNEGKLLPLVSLYDNYDEEENNDDDDDDYDDHHCVAVDIILLAEAEMCKFVKTHPNTRFAVKTRPNFPTQYVCLSHWWSN